MGQAVHAQPVFDIPQSRASVALSQELEYFVDESGQWQPDVGAPAPGEWRNVRDRGGKGNFGFLKHPVWFRVVLRSPTASEWMWVVSTPQLEWVTWVQQRAGRPPERSEAGLGPLQEQRIALQRLPVVKLSLAANEPVTVHMRVQKVWDTGLGIPVREQATIFEAHYRGSAAQTHDKGLGLGLSIVSRCAELLDVRGV